MEEQKNTGGMFQYDENAAASQGEQPVYTNVYQLQSADNKMPKAKKTRKDHAVLKWFLTLAFCISLLSVLTAIAFMLRYQRNSEQVAPSGAESSTPGQGDTSDTAISGESDTEEVTVGEGSEQISLQIAADADEVETYATQVVEKTIPSTVAIDNNYTERNHTIYGVYEEEVMTTGSGIIIGASEKELLIVTNNHVVSGAEDLRVNFYGGSGAPAQIRGTNSAQDLAVIVVQMADIDEYTKGKISVATLGDSRNLKLGEPVIAIGNALGYGQSVTTGVISALNREVVMEDGTAGIFIQTDAAINHGNSGGALLNSRGEVIGINTAKLSETSVEGMGFAIPITMARETIEKLMSIGARVAVPADQKGYLGVKTTTGTDVAGAYIAEVVPGSPAEKAGLVVGDVIVAVEEIEVSSSEALVDAMNYFKIGESVDVTVMKNTMGGYSKEHVNIVLDQKPEG